MSQAEPFQATAATSATLETNLGVYPKVNQVQFNPHICTPPLANLILQCLPASVSPCLPVPPVLVGEFFFSFSFCPPHSLYVDLEPGIINKVKTSLMHVLFHLESMITVKEDAVNNYVPRSHPCCSCA